MKLTHNKTTTKHNTEARMIGYGWIMAVTWAVLVITPLVWSQSTEMIVSHFVFLLFGLGGIVFGYHRLLQGMQLRSQAEESLIKQTAFLDGILQSSRHMAIAATDLEFRILYYNSIAEVIFGYKSEDVLGKTVMEIHTRENVEPARFERAINIVKSTGKYHYSVIQEKQDGLHYIDSKVSGIHGKNNDLVGFVLMSEDITQRKQAIDIIEHQAFFDALTDLPNRRLLIERLVQTLSKCRRHGQLGALLFIDLDHFKEVNDSMGHSAGDLLLQEVTSRLILCLRKEDTTARLGGDEFVVLLSTIDDEPEKALKQVDLVANKVLHTLSSPYTIQKQKINITASIGITLFPMDKMDPSEILKNADSAMYQAKNSGRNAIYIPPLPAKQTNQDRKLVAQDLLQAIKNNQLQLFIQPYFDMSKNLIGAVVLPYWQHTDKKWMLPAELTAMAKETNLILSLNQWLLESACKAIKEWQDNKLVAAPPYLMVQIEPVFFRQPDFTDRIHKILKDTNIPANNLVLEIFETVAQTNSSDTNTKMSVLNDLGITFSITGIHSTELSLNLLQDLPLKMIKIDGSMVQNIIGDSEENSIIDEIIGLARHMNIKAIAEGVETHQQQEFLEVRGCHYSLGDFFGVPLSREEFIAYLREK